MNAHKVQFTMRLPSQVLEVEGSGADLRKIQRQGCFRVPYALTYGGVQRLGLATRRCRGNEEVIC